MPGSPGLEQALGDARVSYPSRLPLSMRILQQQPAPSPPSSKGELSPFITTQLHEVQQPELIKRGEGQKVAVADGFCVLVIAWVSAVGVPRVGFVPPGPLQPSVGTDPSRSAETGCALPLYAPCHGGEKMGFPMGFLPSEGLTEREGIPAVGTLRSVTTRGCSLGLKQAFLGNAAG